MKESNLRQGEKMLYVVKHHGLFLFWPVVLTVLPLVAGLVLPVVLDADWLLYVMALAVPGGLYLLYKLLVLRTDVWTITDRRLVDETGIISRTIKESPFEKINNAETKQGILGRIFGYGDVTVQTASNDGYSVLTLVGDPRRVKNVLLQAVDADLEKGAVEA